MLYLKFYIVHGQDPTNPKFSVFCQRSCLEYQETLRLVLDKCIPGFGSANPSGRKPWLKMCTSLQQWLAERTGK